jgi:hypothetical protein
VIDRYIGRPTFYFYFIFLPWFTNGQFNKCKFFKLRLVTFVIIILSFLWCKLREQKQHWLKKIGSPYRLRLMKKSVSSSALKNPNRSIPTPDAPSFRRSAPG